MAKYTPIKLSKQDMERIMENPVRSRSTATYVYFIKCNSYVKIGYSINPTCRLHDIQVGSPYKCTLLGRIRFIDESSSKEFEEYLHSKFSHLNKRGEWYRLTIELKNYIKENKNAMV